MKQYFSQYWVNLRAKYSPEARKAKPDSIYFFTFHKCASTLFSDYALKHINGLQHVDYEQAIYIGTCPRIPTFEEKGFVYGPIRINVSNNQQTYQLITKRLCSEDFVRDKTAIFLIRDPRDIIISSYYSFGWSHDISPIQEVRDQQEAYRRFIQSKTIDEFALSSVADKWIQRFEILGRLIDACPNSTLLRYEDMINDWDRFSRGYTKSINIDQSVLHEIFKRSRPRKKDDERSHRRSGGSGQFRQVLQQDTVLALEERYYPILKRFGYIN